MCPTALGRKEKKLSNVHIVQCTAEKMGMRRWAKCKNVRKEKYEEENGCSGEDELRKVSVQLSVLNKSRQQCLCRER